jgi:NAD-dependent deacetylase
MRSEENLERVIELLDRSYNTVVVTGAGISTESGLPDFRSPRGIYSALGSDKVMDITNIKTLR